MTPLPKSHSLLAPLPTGAALLIWGLLMIGWPQAVWGHDSPEHVVQWLTQRMVAEGKSAERLYQRAVEYRALGKTALALVDLKDALERDPSFTTARLELARIHLSTGQAPQALVEASRVARTTPNPAERSAAHMVRAQAYAQLGEWKQALACSGLALAGEVHEPDWYLIRAQWQRELGRWDDRAAGLKEGYRRTGSMALFEAWIDALLDAGQWETALEQIEPQLAACRWKSAWWIRRARARLGLGQVDAARQDLRSALAEIDQRLHPTHPDPSLLAERAAALVLLGRRSEARQELRRAEQDEGQRWWLSRWESLLASVPPYEHGNHSKPTASSVGQP